MTVLMLNDTPFAAYPDDTDGCQMNAELQKLNKGPVVFHAKKVLDAPTLTQLKEDSWIKTFFKKVAR